MSWMALSSGVVEDRMLRKEAGDKRSPARLTLLAALVDVAVVLGHLFVVARGHLVAAAAADLAAGLLLDLAPHLQLKRFELRQYGSAQTLGQHRRGRIANGHALK